MKTTKVSHFKVLPYTVVNLFLLKGLWQFLCKAYCTVKTLAVKSLVKRLLQRIGEKKLWQM